MRDVDLEHIRSGAVAMRTMNTLSVVLSFGLLGLFSALSACSNKSSSAAATPTATATVPGTESTFDREMYKAGEGGHRGLMEERIKKGKDINGVNPKNGWTPLHAASYNGHKKLVSYMVTQGANVNAVDRDGNTPLHLAVGRGHMDTVQSLLLGAPNVAIRNNAGKTAGEIASASMLAKFPQLSQ